MKSSRCDVTLGMLWQKETKPSVNYECYTISVDAKNSYVPWLLSHFPRVGKNGVKSSDLTHKVTVIVKVFKTFSL